MWLVFGVAWLALGTASVLVLHRRGHDVFSWAIVFVFLGPLAIPLAVSSHRHPAAEPDGGFHPGELDALVVCDPARGAEALDTVIGLLTRGLTSVTLVTVVDAEAPTTVRGHDTIGTAEEQLRGIATYVATRVDVPVDVVVLHGDPVTVLDRYATEHGYELIVAPNGPPHSRAGATARRLTKGVSVPVLVGPGLK